MNQSVLREERPSCFGRIDDPSKQIEGWNPSCPSCAGGADPTYTDEKTGSHIREKCVFFNSCGSTVQAKKMEQMRTTLVDPKSLMRPTVQPQAQTVPTPTVPAPQYPASVYQPQQPSQPKLAESLQQQQQALLLQQQQQAMMQHMQQQMAQMQRMAPQQQMQMMPIMPQMGYQQMMPVNYMMPSYLSNPEPVEPGGFWRMMGRTVFRSMGKSVGHSVAHIFDSIPFGEPPKPR